MGTADVQLLIQKVCHGSANAAAMAAKANFLRDPEAAKQTINKCEVFVNTCSPATVPFRLHSPEFKEALTDNVNYPSYAEALHTLNCANPDVVERARKEHARLLRARRYAGGSIIRSFSVPRRFRQTVVGVAETIETVEDAVTMAMSLGQLHAKMIALHEDWIAAYSLVKQVEEDTKLKLEARKEGNKMFEPSFSLSLHFNQGLPTRVLPCCKSVSTRDEEPPRSAASFSDSWTPSSLASPSATASWPSSESSSHSLSPLLATPSLSPSSTVSSGSVPSMSWLPESSSADSALRDLASDSDRPELLF